jgi:hypothetical protein
MLILLSRGYVVSIGFFSSKEEIVGFERLCMHLLLNISARGYVVNEDFSLSF